MSEDADATDDPRADRPRGDEERSHGEGRATHDRGDDHHAHDHDHGHHAHDLGSVRFAVLTVSSSRSLDDDPSGDAVVSEARAAGNELVVRELVRDDFDSVQSTVDHLVGREDVDAVVTTGGTGVTPDDVTVEAIAPLFDKRLPGFGELFRRLSFEEVGTRVVGTRAVAGIAAGVPVFCLPGSEDAARLGVAEIVVPEAGHLAGLASR
jgi:molybdenum cofactor biosynthesis protein B